CSHLTLRSSAISWHCPPGTGAASWTDVRSSWTTGRTWLGSYEHQLPTTTRHRLSWRLCPHEGNHSRRRGPFDGSPPDPRHQQTTAARLQQADDLLPAVHVDARGHPGCVDHHHPPRSVDVPAAARRRARDRYFLEVRSAAETRRSRAGIHHRP